MKVHLRLLIIFETVRHGIPLTLEIEYDLVVVGAGISGLAAAVSIANKTALIHVFSSLIIMMILAVMPSETNFGMKERYLLTEVR